jgi:hypothetical protein
VRRTLGLIGLVVAVAVTAWALGPSAVAQGKEQVVFSGDAEGSLGEVGFWIWCAVDEAGAYDDCSGSIHFEDLGIPAKHVTGEVSEPDDDVYLMDVSSSDGSVACTLVNDPPITSGPTNTVEVSCTAPSGTATSNNAVVRATGQE